MKSLRLVIKAASYLKSDIMLTYIDLVKGCEHSVHASLSKNDAHAVIGK